MEDSTSQIELFIALKKDNYYMVSIAVPSNCVFHAFKFNNNVAINQIYISPLGAAKDKLLKLETTYLMGDYSLWVSVPSESESSIYSVTVTLTCTCDLLSMYQFMASFARQFGWDLNRISNCQIKAAPIYKPLSKLNEQLTALTGVSGTEGPSPSATQDKKLAALNDKLDQAFDLLQTINSRVGPAVPPEVLSTTQVSDISSINEKLLYMSDILHDMNQKQTSEPVGDLKDPNERWIKLEETMGHISAMPDSINEKLVYMSDILHHMDQQQSSVMVGDPNEKWTKLEEKLDRLLVGDPEVKEQLDNVVSNTTRVTTVGKEVNKKITKISEKLQELQIQQEELHQTR